MKEVRHMYSRCVVIELWILLYIYCCLLQNMYICVKTLKTLKTYAVMLRLVNDIFPMLMYILDERSGSALEIRV